MDSYIAWTIREGFLGEVAAAQMAGREHAAKAGRLERCKVCYQGVSNNLR